MPLTFAAKSQWWDYTFSFWLTNTAKNDSSSDLRAGTEWWLIEVFVYQWGSWEGLHVSYGSSAGHEVQRQGVLFPHLQFQTSYFKVCLKRSWTPASAVGCLLATFRLTFCHKTMTRIHSLCGCHCNSSLLFIPGHRPSCWGHSLDLCRNGCIALCFEVLPMLTSTWNLVCLMEVLMLRKEIK